MRHLKHQSFYCLHKGKRHIPKEKAELRKSINRIVVLLKRKTKKKQVLPPNCTTRTMLCQKENIIVADAFVHGNKPKNPLLRNKKKNQVQTFLSRPIHHIQCQKNHIFVANRSVFVSKKRFPFAISPVLPSKNQLRPSSFLPFLFFLQLVKICQQRKIFLFPVLQSAFKRIVFPQNSLNRNLHSADCLIQCAQLLPSSSRHKQKTPVLILICLFYPQSTHKTSCRLSVLSVFKVLSVVVGQLSGMPFLLKMTINTTQQQ